MPPRRSATVSESLTPDNLTTLAATVDAGKTATVYLREGVPSLGLAAGASARVTSVSGSTVTVKPRGVDDELPYEADELRMTKHAAAQPEKPRAAKAKSTPIEARPTSAGAPAKPTVVAATSAAQPTAAAKPAAKSPTKPARRATRKALSPVTVTIYGSADNTWSVSVVRGGRKPPRSRSVPADSIEAAMTELGDAAALEATTSILHAAREEAQRRVEELRRELAAAQETLAALDPK